MKLRVVRIVAETYKGTLKRAFAVVNAEVAPVFYKVLVFRLGTNEISNVWLRRNDSCLYMTLFYWIHPTVQTYQFTWFCHEVLGFKNTSVWLLSTGVGPEFA